MARSRFAILFALGVLALHAGCSSPDHVARFQPILECKLPPAASATAIDGTIDEAKLLIEKARLPHHSKRTEYQLMLDAFAKFADQLGSPDYCLIGEIQGGGSAQASQESLTRAMCEKAAKEGGDVILVFARSVVTQPFAITLPGSATTNAYASAYSFGNYATGYGRSHTTYGPGMSMGGVLHKPCASALVFRYEPGINAERQALLRLDDQSLALALAELEKLAKTRLGWEEYRAQCRGIAERSELH